MGMDRGATRPEPPSTTQYGGGPPSEDRRQQSIIGKGKKRRNISWKHVGLGIEGLMACLLAPTAPMRMPSTDVPSDAPASKSTSRTEVVPAKEESNVPRLSSNHGDEV